MYDLTLTFYKKDRILIVSGIDGKIKTFGNVDTNNIIGHPALNNWFSTPSLIYRKSDISHVSMVDGRY